MQRLATWLGTLIALMAIAPAAEAGSYSVSIGRHRFHVEAPKTCRSTSCVSISSHRSFQRVDDAATRPVPTPIAPSSPVDPAIPPRPPQASVVATPPAAPAPTLAATTSQPVVPPQTPRPEPPRPEQPRAEAPRLEPPPVPSPEIKQTVAVARRSDDEQAYTPLGEWESRGAKGTVRIERCGPALCGYALTETSRRGESVLVNMKSKSHDVWTGSIYSRASGNTYYATMTLKSSARLHVEACALWRFWCSGNDWTRIEAPREQLITTSRQWSARS
ncbi:DUF2147 domain-containing protein [Bradyrhizobium sp. WBOS7]|uniref:DUF2147 domain-containing protein n=1 Tax=Bradyrhizobium betae TaxID=244734 RepID=A0AAE9SPV7_9BRAD|nr:MULTISPECIES: DUF2147 domain-containing protein [Bradyrhizobium]MDD1574461.1 DUF2147 domain-containing protein [Bradyrhizobium sp. WBOS1]UUO35571.1 DUF2147 domain-containing protein [Bradyrhizobium sp. WBOS01]MDD1529604.1 DUF2147 domain-containing protein [Bradyrhizobium sp. WBOS2]MDD1580497.1 DUF2147 domain-containing protein [Bradyrhizobium sp. WBOS7]MDD1604182.1 DUF2147 domain-containing protein [Bradyrhizobium sp. WBOS16]